MNGRFYRYPHYENQREYYRLHLNNRIYNPNGPSKCKIYDRQYKFFNVIPSIIGTGMLVTGVFLVFGAGNTEL